MRRGMKRKRFLALLLVLAMGIACFSGRVVARAEEEIIKPVAGTSTNYTMAAGETKHIIIPVSLTSWEYTIDTTSIIAMVESSDDVFEMTEAMLTRENVPVGEPVGLNSYQTTNIEFDIKLKDTAKIGVHEGKVKFTFTGMKYSEMSTDPIKAAEIPFTIRVNREKSPAQVIVDNFKYDEKSAAIGSNFDLSFDVKNEGEIAALNTYMSVNYGSTGIVPNYAVESIKIGDLAEKASSHQNLPVRVLPTAEAGMKSITIHYEYKDADGQTAYTADRTVYVNIIAVSTAASDDAKLTAQSIKLNDEVEVDNPYNVVLSIENIGKETAKNIIAKIADEGGVGATTGILPNYATVGVESKNLKAGEKTEITLPLSVTKSASAGLHELSVQVSYEDSKGNTVTTVTKVYLTVHVPEKQEVKNDVAISQMTQSPAAPMPGDVLTIDFVVTNNGSNDIKNLEIAGDGLSSASFEPLTADARHTVGDLAVGQSEQVTMQFKLGSGIPEGMNELKLAISYADAEGAAQKESKTVYILNVTKVTEEQLKNNIEITNISQSPASPVVGETVTVTFTVENKGTKGITDMKFSGTDLGSSGFEPISSEVYKRVGSIEAGASKKVSMTFKLGDSIHEGFNTLKLEYSYKDADDKPQTEQTAVYILDVQNKNSSINSRPKLIVDSFTLSEEELRAGSTFDFTFRLLNTHASKAAKNIIVTVVQANDVFSATKGSNSFHINAINPGETAENTINLKVKSDTATGSYDLTIKVEYEYDDMAQADAEKGGVQEDLPVKLQAVENSRPALQNLSLGYGWDTPTVNQSTTLMFDFYNMGRSSLNNVYITMESDYLQFETGTSSIIGTVSAGSSSYQEISVLPIMEGQATGKLIVHFEDSNGDEVTKEFEIPQTYIQAEQSMDWNGGGFDPGFDDPVSGNDVVEAKKPLMPTWAYIACLVGALLIGTLFTRGIMIKVYKKKHFGDEV